MRGLWQARDDRVDAGLNATLDLVLNFVPGSIYEIWNSRYTILVFDDFNI